MFEIKVLLCAPAGCKDLKNDAPGHFFFSFVFLNINFTHLHDHLYRLVISSDSVKKCRQQAYRLTIQLDHIMIGHYSNKDHS